MALTGAALGSVCQRCHFATLFPGGVLIEDNTMPELTAERVRELFNYDPLTGVLTWKKQPRGRYKPSLVAGCTDDRGYVVTHAMGRRHYNHRLTWLLVHGAWPAKQIDHINGDKADNRIANLRDVSNTVNMENQCRPTAGNRSGFLGVSWHAGNKKFEAKIMVSGKPIHIGSYTTPEEAHQAYLTAKRQLHAGCTI